MCAPPSTHLRPGILLDRDGTIIVDHGYVGSVDRVEFIEEVPKTSVGKFDKKVLRKQFAEESAGAPEQTAEV